MYPRTLRTEDWLSMTAWAVRSRRLWQSATLGLSLLLVLAGAPTGAESETRAERYEPVQTMAIPLASADTATTTTPPRLRSQSLLSQRPSNLILQLPNFGDRLPLFLWPVQGPVTSGFGLRRSGWHKGIDIKADRGASVGASASGLVVASGFEDSYGYVVKIQHINGFLTVYAHNERNFVRIGDRVRTGQRVATIGRTGRATAPHLHFEIRHDGYTYNPLYLLNGPPVVAVLTARVNSHDDSLHD
jgi:murein DD-endopeptidase MepM/ murein hydrolase activator NlpD